MLHRFLMIFHRFLTSKYLQDHVFTADVSQKSRFCRFRNTTFSFDFYPVFKPFLSYFLASYLFLFPLHLFNEIMIVFSSFLTPKYPKNGPQNGTKKCQKKWTGLPRPSKVYPDLQNYDFGAHLVSFWGHFSFSFDCFWSLFGFVFQENT